MQSPNYYCKRCKHRHWMHSRIGIYHYWNVKFISNAVDWKGLAQVKGDD